ncbi:hypothetical protein ACFFMM_00160 [Micromonospora chaiyaphumensis]|uniref:Uncharacterized protein n=1 Tax=Micromonospora chaiyaphumensis TaxID=307119 RepID=A0A1C4ZIV7_9ACTN|nr:hypothetical protein [Micromonospora chaiyaphumensis]SCF32987.1 hypothetical protein GA0070214_11558 [Micromonospora chaiyaphumensis]
MDRAEFRSAIRRGTTLVADHPAAEPGWRAWVAVSNLTARHNEPPGWRNVGFTVVWHVREWDPHHLENDWCWAEDDGMHTLQRTTSTGEGQLWLHAERFGGVAAFTYPWRAGYPG